MEVEKLPSLKCNQCNSERVMIVNNKQECNDCVGITAQSSDLLKSKRSKFNNIIMKLGDI